MPRTMVAISHHICALFVPCWAACTANTIVRLLPIRVKVCGMPRIVVVRP